MSLAGDTGYSDGRLRHQLEDRDITAYIPVHPKQETSMVSSGDFTYHADHLICPQGKTLRGVRTTNGNGPTSTWRVRMIVRLGP